MPTLLDYFSLLLKRKGIFPTSGAHGNNTSLLLPPSQLPSSIASTDVQTTSLPFLRLLLGPPLNHPRHRRRSRIRRVRCGRVQVAREFGFGGLGQFVSLSRLEEIYTEGSLINVTGLDFGIRTKWLRMKNWRKRSSEIKMGRR